MKQITPKKRKTFFDDLSKEELKEYHKKQKELIQSKKQNQKSNTQKVID